MLRNESDLNIWIFPYSVLIINKKIDHLQKNEDADARELNCVIKNQTPTNNKGTFHTIYVLWKWEK